MTHLSKFRWAALFYMLLVAGPSIGSGSLHLGDDLDGEIDELAVEVSEQDLGTDVESVLDALASNRSFDLARRFGFPSYARRLWVSHAVPSGEQVKASGGTTSETVPKWRDAVRSTLLLGYGGDAETTTAIMTILRSGVSKEVRRSRVGAYVVTDPLVPANSDRQTYQAALYLGNLLQLGNTVGQWARTRGTAYVAVLDNGLFSTGTGHEDLRGAFRPHLSSNFGYASNGFQGGLGSPNNVDEYPHSGAPFAGHGTHVSGIVAATNFNGLGGSGVCPTCSLLAGRVSRLIANGVDDIGNTVYVPVPDEAATGVAIGEMVSRGAQVLNLSLGFPAQNCSTASAVCQQLGLAVARDVVVVAATGNLALNTVDYPASDPRTIAVGATTTVGPIWWEIAGESGSNYQESTVGKHFVGPGADVLSTFYPNTEWNATCKDSLPSTIGTGYGLCTGTSMAAPYVAGLVGLIRSVDPLKSRDDVRAILSGTSNRTLCTDAAKCGNGIPDATLAISASLGGSNVLNRKTPLFAFWSQAGNNHFYTTVPQMAMAALERGELLPQPESGGLVGYQPIGVSIPGYTAFPAQTCSPQPCSSTPLAIATVLTTHVNPLGGGDLAPIYRLSYRCGWEQQTSPPNSPNPVCYGPHPSPNLLHISHFYTTDPAAVSIYTGLDVQGNPSPGEPGLGYKLDGIEGYVFPVALPQPLGTVKLCRKYDALRDDYVLFAGQGAGGLNCSATTDGYSGGNYSGVAGGTDWIGWVYPAGTAPGPTQSNSLPNVSISFPTNGMQLTKGQPYTIQASASDGDGSVKYVRFLIDDEIVGPNDVTPPYSFVWNAKVGQHTISAIAVDNRDAVRVAKITVNVVGPVPVGNWGFETPSSIGPGQYQWAPVGQYVYWSFDPLVPGIGGTGISNNNSPFTLQNPNAPEGSRVGFIQGDWKFKQDVTFGSAGTFVAKFRVAQRVSNQSALKLKVFITGGGGATPIYNATPTSTNYSSKTSTAFTVAPGNVRPLKFLGVNDTYDNTLFFDMVEVIPQ